MRWTIIALVGILPVAAMAQRPGRSEAAVQSRSIAERNHLGLLEYCRGQGMIGDEAVILQRRLVTSLPAVPGQDVEAAGRQGLIVFETSQATFTQSAAAQGITVRFSCEQTALRVLRQEGGG